MSVSELCIFDERLSEPNGVMEALGAHLPQLPRALHPLVFEYQYELPVQTIITRMQISPGAAAEDIVSLHFQFDKIAKVFDQLIKMGREYQCEEAVKNCIRGVAQTTYLYSESALKIQPWGAVRVDYENQVAYWELRLVKSVNEDAILKDSPFSRVKDLGELFKAFSIDSGASTQVVQLSRQDFNPNERSWFQRVFSCASLRSCFPSSPFC